MFIKDFRPVYGYDKQIDNLEDDDLTDLPSKPGVYIIVSFKTKFIYPIGQSKVIYIGKTDNIQRRLKEHQRNLINARKDIEAEKQKTIAGLQTEIAGIALMAASKVVEKEANDKGNEKLLDDFLKEAGV